MEHKNVNQLENLFITDADIDAAIRETDKFANINKDDLKLFCSLVYKNAKARVSQPQFKVEDVMIREVYTVNPQTTTKDALGIMFKHDVSGLPVVDENNKLVGVVSESDLLSPQKKKDGITLKNYLAHILNIIPPEEANKETSIVETVMTKDVISVKGNDTIQDVATIMIEDKINRIPVVNDEEELIGLVCRQDILQTIYK